MCTNSPSLNRAMDGDDGGKGIIKPRAMSTEDLSFPAKAVTARVGLTPGLDRAMRTPGRQEPAAHPHTELTTTRVVPLS